MIAFPKNNRHITSLLQRLARDQRAATMVEYALIVALLASALLITCELIGMATKAPMSVVTTAMQAGDEFGGSSMPQSSGTSPRRGAGLAEEPPRDWRLAGVAVSLALNVLLWYLLYRREKRKAAKSAATAEEMFIETMSQETLFGLRQQMLKILSAQASSMFDGRLLVKHIMCSEPYIVSVDERATELAECLRQRRLRHALVCDDDHKLLGLVSRTDLIGKDQCTAGDVMITQLKTVAADTPLNPAITQLLTAGLSCLPVVNKDGRPLGLLSVFELVLALQCTLMTLQTMSSQNEISARVAKSRTISEVVAMQQSEA